MKNFFDVSDIVVREQGRDTHIIRPEFATKKLKNLMIRGGSFYCVWNEETGTWSRDILDVVDIVDKELFAAAEKYKGLMPYKVYDMGTYRMNTNNSWTSFLQWTKNYPDSYTSLDQKVTYLNQETTIKDYASKRLPYDLEEGEPEAYNELMDTLYDKKERRKLEWAIGAVLNGDGKYIQKMFVLYGPPGSGKSTWLHIVEQLLQGYWTVFDAASLTKSGSAFSTHFFSENPLVAIQHDGQLSKIEDNSLLNSIVSHEDIVVNEKFKAQYVDRANCLLFLGTNSPVKISDSKSGLIRRLIDVNPSGRTISSNRYFDLMDRIPFELGKIANKCLKVYRHFGKRYYDSYRPLSMMYATDVFFNFVADNRLIFEKDDPIDLDRSYAMYKDYCEKTNASFISQRYKYREEMENYYECYDKKEKSFSGFKAYLLDEESEEDSSENKDGGKIRWIVLDSKESLLDKELSSCLAQYGNKDEIPFDKWENVTRTLSEIDTTKLHYVKVPENHIVIDFDLKNEKGEKDATLNLDAANRFPPTYAEYSKGGSGLHLHYIWDGDINSLGRIYSDSGIEVKVFNGGSSLRRKLTFCNNLPIAHISSGLPLKEEKKVVNEQVIKDEQHLRNLIKKCLRKEIHAYTKPNVDYIYKLLDDAYKSGMHYDVRDLRSKVLTFAMKSTNQSEACLKLVNEMKFCSEEASEAVEGEYADERLVFFDCEIFPNVFIICWKYQGADGCVRMINPSPADVGELFKFKLIGFNNRRYDNHILYARYLGYSIEELFKLSGNIINKKRSDAMFKEAYNISYTDVYDFASAGNKQSLKKFEIQLHISHQEFPHPWDKPLDEKLWEQAADYCCNDVIATEKTFEYLHGDWAARQMLAKLAGGTVNDTTNQLTTKFIFGNVKNPKLVYTDLKTGKRSDGTQDPIFFPDYEYIDGKNMFRGEDVGRGGYVWAVPGMYYNVYTFDVAGMHPASIIAMKYFGEYTPRFEEMVNARTHIKHMELDIVREMLNGQLAEFVPDEAEAKKVSAALKTGNNSCYGLSSASFPNAMRHPDNVNNVVALRGALTMANLRDILVGKGAEVIHIKTDSIKVVNPSQEIMDFIYAYGNQYGYQFEIEHHFDRICLVNNSVYIAKLAEDDPVAPGQWTATGAQFADPYIFKTLFSHEELNFYDLCQTKEVKDKMYIDFNENLSEGDHDYCFIGKVGLFCPVKVGAGGGELLVKRDDKYSAVTGTKGYRWLESEQVKLMSKENDIDMGYFHSMSDDAIATISQFGDFEHFVSD